MQHDQKSNKHGDEFLNAMREFSKSDPSERTLVPVTKEETNRIALIIDNMTTAVHVQFVGATSDGKGVIKNGDVFSICTIDADHIIAHGPDDSHFAIHVDEPESSRNFNFAFSKANLLEIDNLERTMIIEAQERLTRVYHEYHVNNDNVFPEGSFVTFKKGFAGVEGIAHMFPMIVLSNTGKQFSEIRVAVVRDKDSAPDLMNVDARMLQPYNPLTGK